MQRFAFWEVELGQNVDCEWQGPGECYRTKRCTEKAHSSLKVATHVDMVAKKANCLPSSNRA